MFVLSARFFFEKPQKAHIGDTIAILGQGRVGSGRGGEGDGAGDEDRMAWSWGGDGDGDGLGSRGQGGKALSGNNSDFVRLAVIAMNETKHGRQ